MKILVAVDGSDISLRAVKFVIALNRELAKPARVTLLAVDPPTFPGVETRIGSKAVRELHEESLEQMLRDARRSLSRAKLDLTERAEIGDVAETILAVAKKDKSYVSMVLTLKLCLEFLVVWQVLRTQEFLLPIVDYLEDFKFIQPN